MGDIPKPSDLPAVVEPTTGGVTVSNEELDSACESLGLLRFRSKTIKALKVLGGALDSDEIARIQAAQVILTQEALSNLLKECEDVIDGAELDETRVDAIRAATAICSEFNHACELTVKMLQSKLLQKNEMSRKFPGFKAGDMVLPIQINVNTEKQKEPEAVPVE